MGVELKNEGVLPPRDYDIAKGDTDILTDESNSQPTLVQGNNNAHIP